MLVYDRLFIPLKMLYACNTSFCRVEDKTSYEKYSKKGSVLVFSSPHQSARLHTENLEARSQERITVITTAATYLAMVWEPGRPALAR